MMVNFIKNIMILVYKKFIIPTLIVYSYAMLIRLRNFFIVEVAKMTNRVFLQNKSSVSAFIEILVTFILVFYTFGISFVFIHLATIVRAFIFGIYSYFRIANLTWVEFLSNYEMAHIYPAQGAIEYFYGNADKILSGNWKIFVIVFLIKSFYSISWLTISIIWFLSFWECMAECFGFFSLKAVISLLLIGIFCLVTDLKGIKKYFFIFLLSLFIFLLCLTLATIIYERIHTPPLEPYHFKR
uniref:Uncharacterized protein n=1 Tax=Phalansterium sp. PJK-2012 TaxID=1267188 RepID=T1QDV6_9EUKA|nr:hypothetical protein [Phalansterium sp. PJK-2012]